MTVGELTARMSAAELARWRAMDRLRAEAQGQPVTPEEKIKQGLAEQAEAGLAAMKRRKPKRKR